jgi:hypothetical protein
MVGSEARWPDKSCHRFERQPTQRNFTQMRRQHENEARTLGGNDRVSRISGKFYLDLSDWESGADPTRCHRIAGQLLGQAEDKAAAPKK